MGTGILWAQKFHLEAFLLIIDGGKHISDGFPPFVELAGARRAQNMMPNSNTTQLLSQMFHLDVLRLSSVAVPALPGLSV